MSMSMKRRGTKESSARTPIEWREWEGFLRDFTARHQGAAVRLEIHDRVTGETVVSAGTILRLIELDVEDEKNPRINIHVQFDNKVVKHILFLPSDVTLRASDGRRESTLEVESINTLTTLYYRD